jgi:tetratricopeptide (TPR) repeat protein
VEKGVHYAEMCAERCEETLSYAQAVDYLKACISLMEKQEKYRIDLLRLKEHLAETYFLSGRYDEALKELDDLLTLKEKPWDIRRKIAGVHLRRGQIDQAIDEYMVIIKDQGVDQDALARAYADLANACLKKGDSVHALEHADKAHGIVKRTGDVIEQSHVLMLLAMAHWSSGMCETAAEYMSECIQIREGFSDPLELAFSYNIMGMILADAKRFDDALDYLRKALEIKERSPDPYGKLAVKNNIALLHSIRGDLIGALKGFEDVLKEAEALGDPSFIFGAASNLGSIYLKANKPEDALRFFERAEKVSEQVSDPNAKANAAYNLACWYRALKRFDDALKWASIAESRAGTDEHRARFALTRCELILESGKEFTADEMERALAVCQACGDRTILAWGHRVASRRSRKAKDLEHSLTHAEEALAISRETHVSIDLGLAYHECARTLKDMGKDEDAKRNASLALGTFIRYNAEELASQVRKEFPGIEPTSPQE